MAYTQTTCWRRDYTCDDCGEPLGDFAKYVMPDPLPDGNGARLDLCVSCFDRRRKTTVIDAAARPE